MNFAQDVCDVIIVNHHGAADVLGALASLELSRCGVVHIVDNSVDAQQADALRAGTAANAQVRLTISECNLGFGRACNLAFAQSQSASVLLLNPDARLRPGAMSRLQQTLTQRPQLGAVAPRIDWTAEGHLVMPNLTSQTPAARITQALISRWAAWWPAGLDRRGRHHALRTMRAMGVMQRAGGGVSRSERTVYRARYCYFGGRRCLTPVVCSTQPTSCSSRTPTWGNASRARAGRCRSTHAPALGMPGAIGQRKLH